MKGTVGSPLKLHFFVTEDWYFAADRLRLAVAAKSAGYDVTVVTRVRSHGEVIRAAGIRLIPFENDRRSLNPLADLWMIVRLTRLWRRERPDIVHNVAMKPVLYGSIAARLARTSGVVNLLAGMGWLFSSSSRAARWLRPMIRRSLAALLRRGAVVVQNADDGEFLARLGIDKSNIRCIGSGVDTEVFAPQPESEGVPVIVLPARILWDKGVGEFVMAADLLRQWGVPARFVLAGQPDPGNPGSIDLKHIHQWVSDGLVEYAGWVENMPELLASSHIVCLPSYREGLPRSLMEAAAAGRAIVTTDVSGCRNVVRDGDNGILVPPRDAHALADALARLVNDPRLRKQMGQRGRALAEREFRLKTVIEQTLALYTEVLS